MKNSREMLCIRLQQCWLLHFLFISVSHCTAIAGQISTFNIFDYWLSHHMHSINYSDIHYYLWTRENIGDDLFYELKYKDLQDIIDSPFKKKNKIYFLFHGYNSAGLDWWILEGKSKILDIENSNIISVDYGELAKDRFYFVSVSNMYKVANHTASYIDWMVKNLSIQLSKVEIIGFSLGGQAAGMTGHYIKSGTVSRVTGLDPAGPAFNYVSAGRRIDQTSATFVDVIHANSGSYFQGCYGLEKRVGHIDFYPNGGVHQPGCPSSFIDIQTSCSHKKAPSYWLESIPQTQNSTNTGLKFNSWPCSKWTYFAAGMCKSCGLRGCPYMGFHINRSSRGIYFLRTYANSPFALGNKQ